MDLMSAGQGQTANLQNVPKIDMKIVKASSLPYIPASHEHPKDPGVMKKVLLGKNDLVRGQIMMVNFCKMPKGKSFEKHYHEDMEEVFILTGGHVVMEVDNEKAEMEKGDAVLVPMGKNHQMTNIFDGESEYIVFGISTEKGGKTINV